MFAASVFATEADDVSGASRLTEPYDEAKLAYVASKFKSSEAPEKLSYQARVQSALKLKLPILKIDDLTNEAEKLAQEVLLADPRIASIAFDPRSKEPIRTEVMTIKPALPGDRVGTQDACWQGGCFRINLYSFYFNATISALVDTANKRVISINSIEDSQPELSQSLKSVAVAIAKYESAVQLEVGKFLSFLGENKKAEDVLPVMVDTKSALKDTLCERSRHLCVAPTYVLGNKALWVIVDLTDMKVVGLRWTDVGNSGPPTIVTERKIEDEFVYKNFCEQVNSHKQAGWEFDYHITSSDGLRIANATFKSKPVFSSAKVVDWHVSYSQKERFGYSDATGCPIFSSAVVVAYDGPKFEPIIQGGDTVGFAITQDFRQLPWPAACNYRYQESYQFYNDGRYRVALTNHGRGCGDDGTYRPVLRVDLGGLSQPYQLSAWQDNQWQDVTKESWVAQPEKANLWKSEYSHKISSGKNRGYLLAPSNGQFGDGGRGDNAYIYVSVKHSDKDEGDRDLVTLGSCCNVDHQQGPEQFMSPPEPLKDQSLVLWYVPQLKNDGKPDSRYCWAESVVVDGVQKTKTWPCTGGPMFVPVELGVKGG